MERFSPAADDVVSVADHEARRLGHAHIGTEHLLLGLISVDSPAAVALAAAGVTPDAARDKVAEAVGSRAPSPGEPGLSDRARRALDRASRLSLSRRDDQVEPEHILIGVLDVEGRAGQVLRALGVDVGRLRDAAESESEPQPVAPAETRPAVRCSSCGADLGAHLQYQIVRATGPDGDRWDFLVSVCGACRTALGAAPR